MLYWRSNTGTTACIDYTNGALEGAFYIGGATLEQWHVLFIPREHSTTMLYWRNNTDTTASIDYTNGALGGISYIDGAASYGYRNERSIGQNNLYWFCNIGGQHLCKSGVATNSGRWRPVLLTGYRSS